MKIINKILDEILITVLGILVVIGPFVLYTVTVSLYTPSTITGTVQIIKNENTGEPYQIVLRGEGDNILGDKDFVVWRSFDEVAKIMCERENITDGDNVVFNRKGIIQYKINE